MSIQYEAPYLEGKIEEILAVVRSTEAETINNLEIEMLRRRDLQYRQQELAIARVDLLRVTYTHEHELGHPRRRRQDAAERHDKIQRLAATANSELDRLRSRKAELIKSVAEFTREAGELEGRRKRLHRMLGLRTNTDALADLLKVAHALGNLLGQEHYLSVRIGRLRSLAFIWKEAADGVVNLNAPPAYEEPPMSPTTPAEAGIYAEEYRLLESEVRRQSGLDNPHEPGDRNTHSELDELALAAEFWAGESHPHGQPGSHSRPARPTLPRLDTHDPRHRTIVQNRFSAAFSPLDAHAAAAAEVIDWRNVPEAVTSPIQSLDAFLLAPPKELLRTGASRRHGVFLG